MREKRDLIHFQEIGIPEVETLCYVRYSRSHSPIRLHTHPGKFEICCHCAGTQVYVVNGQEYRTSGGDIFISFPGEPHSTGSYCEEKSTFYYIIFDLDGPRFLGFDEAQTAFLRDALRSRESRLLPMPARLREILAAVFREFRREHPLRTAIIRALLTEFFCGLGECSGKGPKPPPQDIGRVLEHLERHPDERCSLAELAALACLSLPRFKQKFREVTGVPAAEYAMRLRIARARVLLADGGRSTTQIALELGFSSSQHFAAAFKKYTMMTPREYRASL